MSQTLYEYENELQSQLPEVSDEVSSMTNTFVEARYSKHALSEDHAEWVRILWERIRNSLKKR